MKRILLILLLSIGHLVFAQSDYKISGTIQDENGTAVSFATVRLESSTLATIANADGYFAIDQVPNGSVTLIVSSIGFQTHRLSIDIDKNTNLGIIQMIQAVGELDQVVVTASRLQQTIADVPIPISVISGEQIRKSGNLRLDEMLIEQTGLVVNSDHGTGIQIQGMNSEYILILVDGEPLIGRTAGTFDLSRVTINNIDRIEVVKGPSSSLYGSEAMGGVINIITKNGADGFSLNLGAKYRRFNSSNLSAGIDYGRKNFLLNAFYNRLSSDGYDLNSETLSQTVSAYTADTYQLKIKYDLTRNLSLSVSGRYYEEPQEDQTMVSLSNGQTIIETLHDYNAKRTDWNILPKLEWRIGNKLLLTARQYLSNYETETRITRASDNNLFSLDEFRQRFSRSEAQVDFFVNPFHTLSFGAGYIREEVNSTRYVDSTFTSKYVFAQHRWEPIADFDVTVGMRYDNHEAYGDNFSPKLAIGYNFNEKLKLKASFGGGFKAPDFRQLLLDFTNPTILYSVMGTSVVVDGVERLIGQGETFRSNPITNPNAIESARANAAVAAGGLNAERSLAWNFGAEYQLNPKVRISANLFRNNISNLIDTWAIAQKDNGQFVFSYRNVEDIVTQGLELESNLKLSNKLKISFGYQFLDTFDQTVIDQIESGTLAYREPGEIVSRQVTRSNYGGLFGRSKHSGNIKVSYTYAPLGLDIYFRSIYRGRWGFGDRDGNQILVGDAEYADGYFMHNISFQKQLGDHFLIDFGANNLLDTTNEFEASLPGRIWFVGVNYRFNSKQN